MPEADAEERTNSIGLFNTARSYWRSGEHLRNASLKVSHPDAPVSFLLCHAIELYLKAYLRGGGATLGQLKKIGHRVGELAKSATSAGLSLDPEQSEILSHIDEADVAIEARYIVTGFKTRAPSEALSEAAAHLDQRVCNALRKLGLPVRVEEFETPEKRDVPDQGTLEPDAARVLLCLFGAAEIEDRGISAIASTLRLAKGMLRYHLDRLDELDFAVASSVDQLDEYWVITPSGRKYVVSHGLHKLVKAQRK